MDLTEVKGMLISIIVTTYNRPAALRVVLLALNQQTDLNFEVVVADDGSKEDTRRMITELRPSLNYRLVHAWQEDKGFRAARARNLAVTQSKGEYLVFLDGDSVPRGTFVAHHRALAEQGWMVAGNRILLSPEFTT